MARVLEAGIGTEQGIIKDLPDLGKEPRGNKELLAYYQEKLVYAKGLRDEEAHVEYWEKYRDGYRNKFPDIELSQNQVYANGKVIVPASSFNRPRVILVPHNDPRMWFHAKILERIDNFLLDRCKVRELSKELALDTYLYGRAFCKCGFDTEYFAGLDTSDRYRHLEYNDFVQVGMPWALRVDPRDIWVVARTPKFAAAQLVFHRYTRSHEDVLQDKRYDGPHKDNIPAPTTRNAPVEIYEVHDKKRGLRAAFLLKHESFLKKPEEYGWWPYDSLAWNEDGDWFWPVSDVAQIWPQQLEMNRTREQIRRHSQSTIAKVFYDQTKIEATAMNDFLANKVALAIPVDGDPNTIVKQFNIATPPELYQFLGQCRADMRETLGISMNLQGEYAPKSRTTAFETGIVHEGAQTRLVDRKHEAAALLSRLVRRLNEIIFLEWRDQETANSVMVERPDGSPVMVNFILDDLRDVDYDIEVNIEDRPEKTAEQEKHESALMVQLLQQNPAANPLELKQLVLDMFNRPALTGKGGGGGQQAQGAMSGAPTPEIGGGGGVQQGGMGGAV